MYVLLVLSYKSILKEELRYTGHWTVETPPGTVMVMVLLISQQYVLIGMNHEKINFFGINFDLLGK